MSTQSTILRFELKFSGHPIELYNRFMPQGMYVLNTTEWRKKEPRSCAVTKISTGLGSEEGAADVQIEVEYRPKGCVKFVGGTKYDGWTALMVDRSPDGELLNGKGEPLANGEPPVYRPVEVYRDVEFNDLDFGEFVGEFEMGLGRLTYHEASEAIVASDEVSVGLNSTFMAPRRHRPNVKLVLSNAPSGVSTDGFGTKIIRISNYTPHLKQAVLDEVTSIVSGFIEGRYSLNNMSSRESTLIEISSLLVDCTPNEHGQESRFDCLSEYMSSEHLEDLAHRIAANYTVDVSVVHGERFGLLLTRPTDSDG